MNNTTDVHDFHSVLISMIDERFPNTEKYIIHGGDYYKDLVCELRENGKALRYSPYELYGKSKNYEETIDEFIKQWETVLQQ